MFGMGKVLIVDDTPSQLALMTKVVEGLGHIAFPAGDGESCLVLARLERPDLILMDVVMPHMDGFNACRRLKREDDTAGIPIVIVTTKDKDSDKFWAQRQGANAFLTKPYTPDALKSVIRQFLP